MRPMRLRRVLLASALLSSACSRDGVVWPIANSGDLDADTISSPYGPRDQSGTYDFHAGVDFAVPEGTKVRAIKAGTVERRVEWNGEDASGNWILIDHGGGEKSAYLHLSKLGARQGEEVHAGEVIGRSGSSGNTTPHLHLTYMTGIEGSGADEGRSRNPLELLPHSDMPAPLVAFDADAVVLDMQTMPMSVQRIRLEGGGQTREIDYADIVARGNPDRDEHVQGGIWIGVVDFDRTHFELTLRPDPADFVVERVVLEDYAGAVVLDAAR
jgi:hypothetical protein